MNLAKLLDIIVKVQPILININHEFKIINCARPNFQMITSNYLFKII